MMGPEPFPWAALMARLLGKGKITPRDFWALSLPELKALLSLGGGQGLSPPMCQAELARLQTLYPDQEN